MSDGLLQTLLAESDRRGMSQKSLAASAGITPETLTRAKKRGGASLDVIEALAGALDFRLELRPAGEQPGHVTHAAPESFRGRHRHLIWSNPDASDEVLIRRALLESRFTTLLDAAVEFGIEQLDTQWQLLLAEDAPDTHRAAPTVDRILRHIHAGNDQATA